MILVRLQGGLGNQMFQYAFGYRLAQERGVPLLCDVNLLNPESTSEYHVMRDLELGRAFDLELEVANCLIVQRFNGVVNPSFIERLQFKWNNFLGKNPLIIQKDHETIEISQLPKEPLCIVGRWQGYHYFRPVENVIRNLYSPDRLPVNDYSRSILESFSERITVAVHVRRGDYAHHPIYAHMLGALDVYYYNESMNKIASELDTNRLTFLLISDDLEWCRKHITSSFDLHFVNQEGRQYPSLSDLWLLTQTDHCIISNSTFGWWGAYLGANERMVLAPKTWARDPTQSPARILLSNWVSVPNNFENPEVLPHDA